MLFNINKNLAVALLKIMIAIFIVIVPSFLGFLPLSAATYLMFVVFGLILLTRIKTNGKLTVSFQHLLGAVLLVYVVLSSLWAGNREGNMIYFFAIGCILVFSSVCEAYFEENTDTIRHRLKHLLSISGFLCSIVNIVYWIMYIVPVAGKEHFSKGMGTDTFLSVFILLCVLATVSLMKNNSGSRKILFFIETACMVFVFIMAKSVIGWILAVILISVTFSRQMLRSEKGFITVCFGAIAVFIIAVICCLSAGDYGVAFADVFKYGAKHIFGVGGGFWSGKDIFTAFGKSTHLSVGLLPYMFASSGLLGLVCCLGLLLKSTVSFLKLKTWDSFVELILFVAIMFVPFGESLTVLLFWIGFSAYNEYLSGMYFKIQIKEKDFNKTIGVLAVSALAVCLLLVLSFVKMSADSAYRKKDYATSYSLYNIASSLNWNDGESCCMAAASLRKQGISTENMEQAIRLIDKAIKRDKYNLSFVEEKALIYDSCGEYDLSAQQYREASQDAFVKDKYNMKLAKELFKVVKKYPKGSSETKRAYEELILIAQATEDLDLRKEINDIADKALSYTKGELSSEGQIINP